MQGPAPHGAGPSVIPSVAPDRPEPDEVCRVAGPTAYAPCRSARSVGYMWAMSDAHPYRRDESEAERLDRNFGEQLQEVRIAQAGVQILFAFLLTIPFQQRFSTLTGPAARHLRRHAGVHRDQHARVHDARRDAPDALP